MGETKSIVLRSSCCARDRVATTTTAEVMLQHNLDHNLMGNTHGQEKCLATLDIRNI